jgi:hypothetical protein
MRRVVEIASCGMIYIPSLMKIGSAIQKLIGGERHRHPDSKVTS